MKPAAILVAIGDLAVIVAGAVAAAQHEGPIDFTADQVRAGAAIYEQNCSACHGTRMADPNSASDLRKFPRDQKSRFVTAVTKGKLPMPPWADVLKPEDVNALWAYVVVCGQSRDPKGCH